MRESVRNALFELSEDMGKVIKKKSAKPIDIKTVSKWRKAIADAMNKAHCNSCGHIWGPYEEDCECPDA